MTHLYIELNTGLTEEVNSSIISKLYELAISGDLDETSDLKGRLHSTVGYRSMVLYLTTQYPNLYITVDDYAIPFEDSNMLRYLLDRGIGSNGMITEDLAAAVTSVVNSANSTITKFNELKYFTSITATGTYTTKFVDWTALEEIDLSNFTRVGGATSSDWQGSFLRCNSLKKVIASDKLTTFGHAAFNGCSNLELITGVTGAVSVGGGAFESCSKLPQSFFQPLIVTLTKTDSSGKHFYGCTLLQSINIAEGNTVIPTRCFYNCTNLTSVTIPSTLTTIEDSAFYGCTALTSIDLSNLTSTVNFGDATFRGCTKLTTVTGMSEVTTIPKAIFADCTSLTSVDVDWSKITTIGDSAFDKCLALLLTTADFTNVESIGDFAFRYTTLNIVDLSSATTIEYGAFDNATVLYMHIPGTVKTLPNYMCNFVSCHYKIDEGVTTFGNTSIRANRLILPSTITQIDNYSYSPNSTEFLVIKATTPPTYSSTCFSSNWNYPIYVPDNSVAVYKAQPGGNAGGVVWEDRIKSFTDFEADFPGISLNGTGYATDPI